MSSTTEMAVLRIVKGNTESAYECIDQSARTSIDTISNTLTNISNTAKRLVFGDTLSTIQSSTAVTVNTKLARSHCIIVSGIASVGNNRVSSIVIPASSEATSLTVNCSVNPGECANFACEIQNYSSADVTITVTINSVAGSTGRAAATDGKLGSGKFCQITCVGNCWTMAEFEPIDALCINGRIYPTVKIGNQIWMAENLDFKWDGLAIGYSETNPSARYYSDNEETYGEAGNKYGLLYNLAAMEYLDANKETLIPGWHIPSSNEWETLVDAVGGSEIAGTKLKSTTGWNDIDGQSGNGDGSTTFNAVPTGRYNSIETPHFDEVGNWAIFWTTTPSFMDGTYTTKVLSRGSYAGESSGGSSGQYSIRLVKNST